MGRNIRISIDLNGEKHIKLREYYAEYDAFTNTIVGFGGASSAKFKTMDFDPTFEAILYDTKNRICDTTIATYNGVYSKTGKMVLRFAFEDVPEFNASHIRLMLIAKEDPQAENILKFS